MFSNRFFFLFRGRGGPDATAEGASGRSRGAAGGSRLGTVYHILLTRALFRVEYDVELCYHRARDDEPPPKLRDRRLE
jgi:hypothetical protein